MEGSGTAESADAGPVWKQPELGVIMEEVKSVGGVELNNTDVSTYPLNIVLLMLETTLAFSSALALATHPNAQRVNTVTTRMFKTAILMAVLFAALKLYGN